MLEVGEKTKTRLPGWRRKLSIAATLVGWLAGSAAWALDAVKGPVSFSGPLLRDVLQRVRAKGQTLQAVALNGHRLKLSVSDALEHDVVVAFLKNGQSIPVRSKGPLFIVSHFDAQKELQHKMPVERWMRQLEAIEVE